MENNKEIPQKIKNRTTIWSRNRTSGYISKGNENRLLKRYLYSHVYYNIIHNNQDTKITQVSDNR